MKKVFEDKDWSEIAAKLKVSGEMIDAAMSHGSNDDALGDMHSSLLSAHDALTVALERIRWGAQQYDLWQEAESKTS